MSQIILDLSANTHKNDICYITRMLTELKAVDRGKHDIVIKHQLFTKAGDNIPLDHKVFAEAYIIAKRLGYKTTSSVFDRESLDFLLTFDIPFVKIANNRNLDYLTAMVPRNIPVYTSFSEGEHHSLCMNDIATNHDVFLACVSKYPAKTIDYAQHYEFTLVNAISDHTENWDLYDEYEPKIYECHFKLEDSTGLDAGTFARTPMQLSMIL